MLYTLLLRSIFKQKFTVAPSIPVYLSYPLAALAILLHFFRNGIAFSILLVHGRRKH